MGPMHQFLFPVQCQPNVMVWIAGIDQYSSGQADTNVWADSIDATSFTCHLKSSLQPVFAAIITWIVTPADRTGVACGNSVLTADPNNTNLPVVPSKQRRVELPRGSFSVAPTVLVAIDGWIFANPNKGLRLRTTGYRVSTIGFNWLAATWGETVLNYAAIDWVAFEPNAGGARQSGRFRPGLHSRPGVLKP